MKRWILFSVVLCAVSPALVHGQEKIFVKVGKEFKTPIKKESGLGVLGAKDLTPAEDIVDIEYEVLPESVRINIYRKARTFERESQETVDAKGKEVKELNRRVKVAEAIKEYEETLKNMAPGQDMARRNIEFRIAVLKTRQAMEFNQAPLSAQDKLEDFKKNHPDSWQITKCMHLLANLHLGQKKYPQAEKAYLDLSKLPVAEDTKSEAEFLAAQVNLQAGNFDKALTSLRGLSGRLPKENRFGMRARVAEAECLAVANKTDDANKLLRGILKDSTDKTLKAMAYNTLGKNLYKQGQYKEARWEFLWVDVVYNQDKGEHAKSLYYLGHIFEKLGETDRAKDCRDQLLTDRLYAGSEFQRLAQAEAKMP